LEATTENGRIPILEEQEHYLTQMGENLNLNYDFP
jgi:hypothetical protein